MVGTPDSSHAAKLALASLAGRRSNGGVHRASSKPFRRRPIFAASPAPQPVRFTLRTLFGLMAAVGVLCAIARSLAAGDSTIVLGIGAFCYGGIVAIPCFAFIASLLVLTTTTTRGQQAGEVFAAVIAAATWIGFIIAALRPWPQLCVVESAGVISLVAWLVRRNQRQLEAGPSPEATLARLRSVKARCWDRSAVPGEQEGRTGPPNQH
jgi:hypothetical protein